jgi:hypothetical protein
VNQRPKVCFQGQTPGVTKGFTLRAPTRDDLIRQDPGSTRYIHPFLGGEELLHDLTIDRWIIDLPHLDALEAERNTPVLMDHLRREVLPARKKAAQKEARQNTERLNADPKAKIHRHHSSFLDTWWMHSYRRTDMVVAVESLVRYIALTITATWERPSVYSFIDSFIRPAASLQVFAFDDNYSFGILSSGLHRLWFEARCSRLETRLRYTPTTVFDSFPWPQSPTEAQTHTIQEIVEELLALRSQNLSAGMTLARQYDTLRQPGNSQLRNLHADLDDAVLNAYSFSPHEDLLAQLLALNLEVAARPKHARGPGSTSVLAGGPPDFPDSG